MNKSILIIDTPESCTRCNLRYDSYGQCEVCILADDIIDYFYEANTKPTWCPLISLPEKRIIYCTDTTHHRHIKEGYNLCLGDIQKGTQSLERVIQDDETD